MYIDFITEYWYLFAMLLAIVFMLGLEPAQRKATGSRNVSPAELPKLQFREQAVVLDLSDNETFKQGHVSRAINIPFRSLNDSISKIRKHQTKPVVLVCETGANSRKAAAVLKKNEFSNIYILNGGLASWKKENLPLEKGRK
ncbi:MAG: rhodanese-like domain-containing protein [Gammaproteobacteria bacterium]|nr:rhodanese-like domain-containing protein [Gammaproteobacteria bacterium]MCY4217666.1 rhodanese-like domain-containing protein [Gammaproteobacteria bacterium]MCY4275725.1 rhodanese-like domain-containing protein [Gammaproteobacteria bacterium]